VTPTGAAALLTDRLGRALNITQGTGSQILTAGPGSASGDVDLRRRARIGAVVQAGPAFHDVENEGR
jgi:hypothetical protein